ncbi:MAG: dTMP kinase [Kiritimatiellae bacterium]|nr:dTMP kinase [Kiritimatiellia bacterium]
MRGKFVVLEGPDGSGKTTQAKELAARLRNCGKDVVCVREPGGTILAEKIRALILDSRDDAPNARAETLLFLAARAQVAAGVIAPAIEAGKWVVCDRFTYSTVAYQGYGRGFSPSVMRDLNRFALPEGLEPDAVAFIDVPLETTFARLAARRGTAADNIEKAGGDFHRRVREGFILQAKTTPNATLIDGTGTVEATSEAIWNFIKPLI